MPRWAKADKLIHGFDVKNAAQRLTMTDNFDGRMLLSHNFTLDESKVHSLNRADFAKVFTQGLADKADIRCNPIENPHWVVEVLYAASKLAPKEVGQLCAEVLASYRKGSQSEGFCVLALGGEKTTPPTGELPALQTGEWGVDMVETTEPEAFLAEINWDKLSEAKPAEQVFRIDQPI